MLTLQVPASPQAAGSLPSLLPSSSRSPSRLREERRRFARHENWGIFKCHKWGELLRHSKIVRSFDIAPAASGPYEPQMTRPAKVGITGLTGSKLGRVLSRVDSAQLRLQKRPTMLTRLGLGCASATHDTTAHTFLFARDQNLFDVRL